MSNKQDVAIEVAGIGCMGAMVISGIGSALLPVVIVLMQLVKACN